MEKALAALEVLENETGKGNDFLGWKHLPSETLKSGLVAECEAVRDAWKNKNVDLVVVIGIGGSYLGARAAIEMLTDSFYNLTSGKNLPKIIYAGNSISSSYLADVIELIKDKDFSVNVISKSGTTTEPAIAFRIFRKLLIDKYGKEGARERIYATTDKAKGTLKELSDREGFETFVVPDDVGGRYSVLTASYLMFVAENAVGSLRTF